MIKKKKKVVKKLKKRVVQKKKVVKKKTIRKKLGKKSALKVSKKTTKKVKKTGKKEGVVGAITHYFPHVQAAVIKLKAPLAVGDRIKIKGHTTDFTQVIGSMQIDRVDIASAKPGQEIGLLVTSRVRQHDIVTKV
ncbi:MAG: hypothetical protein PHP89_05830 [Candidatus Omnitrophica bacterium]|jgi:putative protease|nr:hypothetical protein [Candidatus Omnitrophota bacterium]MDD3988023.1 hypothetical protein [Candidatus Omnitrophota bacterium]MDD4982320.1 hypothetical protein [Candidatus Omnitrophota bacterium]MDD5665513.1 hypothetical protein [Candidatus Omnitrophota bacterium]